MIRQALYLVIALCFAIALLAQNLVLIMFLFVMLWVLQATLLAQRPQRH